MTSATSVHHRDRVAGARRPHLDASTRRAQILDATVVLVARLGPDQVSIRQIAAAADVNHASIYRHFRDRASLIAEAIAGELHGWADVVADASGPTAAVSDAFGYLTARPHVAGALARARPGTDQADYPVVDALRDQLVAAGAEPGPAAETATALVALMTGWVAAEPFWVAAQRLDGDADRARARAALVDQLTTLVRAAVER